MRSFVDLSKLAQRATRQSAGDLTLVHEVDLWEPGTAMDPRARVAMESLASTDRDQRSGPTSMVKLFSFLRRRQDRTRRLWLDLGELGVFVRPAGPLERWQDHGLGLLRTILRNER